MKITTAKQAEHAPEGTHSAGQNLMLRVRGDARSWFVRYTSPTSSKRRDLALGTFPDLSLAQARIAALEAIKAVRMGLDPIEERRRAVGAAKAAAEASAARAEGTTFAQAASAYVASQAAGWKNPKHIAQWSSTLASLPFGSEPVASITLDQIEAALRPRWVSHPETSTRLLQRCLLVLEAAADKGQRDPVAGWRERLRRRLPKLDAKSIRVKHHRALDLDAVPPFVARLRQQRGTAARALEFVVLSSLRSGEVRAARWDWLDLDGAQPTLTVPAEAMKMKRAHAVPLCPRAVELIREAQTQRAGDCPLIFPSQRGSELSDMAILSVLRRMKIEATVHGFRSCARVFTVERTEFGPEVAEQMLAHSLPAVQAAYQRSQLFAKRVGLMKAWGEFCGSACAPSDS